MPYTSKIYSSSVAVNTITVLQSEFNRIYLGLANSNCGKQQSYVYVAYSHSTTDTHTPLVVDLLAELQHRYPGTLKGPYMCF